MPHPLTVDEADRLAEGHFATTCSPDIRRTYRVTRVAVLPRHGKVFYEVTWALERPWTEEDLILGSAGFFVSLEDGLIVDVGYRARNAADAYIRARDHLAPDTLPRPGDIAEALATYRF